MGIAITIVVALIAIIVLAALLVLILKVLFRLVVAAFCSSLLAIVVGVAGLEVEKAAWIGILSLPLAIMLVWKWLGPIDGHPHSKTEKVEMAETAVENRPVKKPIKLEKDVEAGWDSICSHFSASDIAEMEHYRDQNRLLLQLARESDITAGPEIAEQAMLIRRHIPAIADEFKAASSLLDGEAWTELMIQTRQSLERVGRRSFDLLAIERSRRRDALELRNRHLSGRMQIQSDRSIIDGLDI